MAKYLKIIGILELISWLIGLIYLFVNICKGFYGVLPAILILASMLFFGPAVGLLFIGCSENMQDKESLRGEISSLQEELHRVKSTMSDSGMEVKEKEEKKIVIQPVSDSQKSLSDYIDKIREELKNRGYSEKQIEKAMNDNLRYTDDWFYNGTSFKDAVNMIIYRSFGK